MAGDARDAFPCAKAEAVAATSAIEDKFLSVVLVHKLFLFVPSKVDMVLVRQLILDYFTLVWWVARLFTDLQVCPLRIGYYLVPPCAWVMPSYVSFSFF